MCRYEYTYIDDVKITFVILDHVIVDIFNNIDNIL